jgi:hypothetical protein
MLRPRLCLLRIIRILDELARGHVNMAVCFRGTNDTYRVIQGLPEGSFNYGDYSAWLLGGSAVIGTLEQVSDCNPYSLNDNVCVLNTVNNIPGLDSWTRTNVSPVILNAGMCKALSSGEVFTHLPETPYVATNIARYALIWTI